MSFHLIDSLQTTSEKATAAFAAVLSSALSAGDLVALVGDLGCGKSVIARTIIRTLLGDADLDVPSPTFTLVQEYEGPDFAIWHADLYRLEDSEDVYELGFEEALDETLLLVEWPDRLPEEFHENCLILSLKQTDDQGGRMLSIQGHDGWRDRLLPMMPALKQAIQTAGDDPVCEHEDLNGASA